MDGARQIVIPATVSLLCICIVFVPMFNLGGVGGYLFRPMAEAVVFALVASYVLSRTLVTTMARFLLADQATMHEPRGAAADPQSAGPFPARIRTAVRVCARLLSAPAETAFSARGVFIGGFPGRRCASFALAPYLGRKFFPSIANTQIKLHVRAPTGTRIEDTAIICDGVERTIRRIIPPDALGPMVDNIGLPVSGINSDVQQLRHRRSFGCRHPDHRQAGLCGASGRLRHKDARDAAEILPGHDVRVPAGGHRLAILNFGLPAPIDVQVVGRHFAANQEYAEKVLRKIARVAGVADARIQQAANYPTLGVDVDRMRAAQVGLSEGDVAKSLQESLSGSFKVAPTFWVNPKNGVAYPIVAQTPQYWLDSVSSLENIPASKEDELQILGGLATLKREVSPAVVTHYAVQPVSRFTRPTTSATSARCPPISRKSSTRPQASSRPAPASCCAGKPRR